MKYIKPYDDLHLEFSHHTWDHIYTPSETDKDTLLILAGDIDTGINSRGFIEKAAKNFKYIVMVAGNHEYYGNDFNTVNEEFKRKDGFWPNNFYFLNKECVILDGIRIFGGTMWTSFNNGNPMSMYDATRTMNDYVKIKNGLNYITPEFIYSEHKQFMSLLTETLENKFDGRTIIVSHHSPCLKFAKGWHGDEFYHVDNEQLILDHPEISHWFFGHTHDTFDVMIGDTHVMNNPYGYHNYQQNKGFMKDLLLHLE